MARDTCLLCFAVNIETFDIKDTHLQRAYEEITDNKINVSHYLCYICHKRLQQFYLLLKQSHDFQKKPQDDQLSTVKVISFTVPDIHMEKHIKQEADIKQETPKADNYLKNKGPEDSPENLDGDKEGTSIKVLRNRKRKKLNRKHSGGKPYSCSICDQEFSFKSLLKVHNRIHTGEKPYACNLCDVKCSLNSDLKKHKLIHAGEKPYICDICNMAFSQSGNLSKHKKIHTGEKAYSCDVCGKQFSYNYKLKIHKRTHTGDKPYSCALCDHKFSTTSNLRSHFKIHTGEKPFSCGICDLKFSHKGHLNRHNKIHH